MTIVGFEDVLTFWLGDLDEVGCASADTSARWWKKSDAFDAEIRERFEPTYRAIRDGALEDWLSTPRGRVAYVIVLDQFSRNMYRGQAQMYAEDARALRAVLEGLDSSCDDDLRYHERYFLYMPLMHAEDAVLQHRCVAAFEGMKESFPDLTENIDRAVGFAVKHRDIVVRFDRFPHRNEILSRESTPEEATFLEGPGSSF